MVNKNSTDRASYLFVFTENDAFYLPVKLERSVKV